MQHLANVADLYVTYWTVDFKIMGGFISREQQRHNYMAFIRPTKLSKLFRVIYSVSVAVVWYVHQSFAKLCSSPLIQ